MSEFKIEKNVPLDPGMSRSKYPWTEMEVGRLVLRPRPGRGRGYRLARGLQAKDTRAGEFLALGLVAERGRTGSTSSALADNRIITEAGHLRGPGLADQVERRRYMVRTGCWHASQDGSRGELGGLSAAEAWAVFRRLISRTSMHGRR